jgi:hypothetical protein
VTVTTGSQLCAAASEAAFAGNGGPFLVALRGSRLAFQRRPHQCGSVTGPIDGIGENDEGGKLMALPRQLVNGSFEEPKLPPKSGEYFPDEGVPGWRTLPAGDKIELWSSGNEEVYAVEGEGAQFAELNTDHASTLYQDLETTPGTTMYWRLLHRGREGVDTMAVIIGPPGKPGLKREISDGTRWGEHRGSYIVPTGQTTTRLTCEVVAVANPERPSVGNLLDGVAFAAYPDELPPIFAREDVIVPRPSELSGSYIIYHHVSAGYLYPDLHYTYAGSLVQTWYPDPVEHKEGAWAGWRWVLERADGGYLIQAHEPSGETQLYLEADKDTGDKDSMYPRLQARKAGNDLQIWYMAGVSGDPDTYAIVAKKFPQHALGVLYGQHVGVSSHCILSRSWGHPLLQHYWRLQAVTEDKWVALR